MATVPLIIKVLGDKVKRWWNEPERLVIQTFEPQLEHIFYKQVSSGFLLDFEVIQEFSLNVDFTESKNEKKIRNAACRLTRRGWIRKGYNFVSEEKDTHGHSLAEVLNNNLKLKEALRRAKPETVLISPAHKDWRFLQIVVRKHVNKGPFFKKEINLLFDFTIEIGKAVKNSLNSG